MALVLAVVLLWLIRVPLLNWGLRFLPGDYEITVTGFYPGFQGATLSGVRVVHRPTGRQLAHAKEAVATGNWPQLFAGRLQELKLIRAEVHWRDEFYVEEPIPDVIGPAASVIASWESGIVEDGVFSWYSTGEETPRLSMQIESLKGGRFAIYNDATVEAAPQELRLKEVVSRETALDGQLEILTRSAAAAGTVTASQKLNQYTVEQVTLQEAALQLTLHRKSAAPQPVEDAAPSWPVPAWYKPVEFIVKEGTAAKVPVLLSLHQADAAPVDFSGAIRELKVAGLRAGGGQPCVIARIDAGMENLKSPGAGMEARELTLQAALDEKTRLLVSAAAINGAVVSDSSRFLAALGISEEMAGTLPVCRTGLDARCVNLLLDGSGLTSPDPQQLLLKDFEAREAASGKPLVALGSAEVSAVLDEVFNDKRLREVSVEAPKLWLTESELPDGLNPLSTPVPPQGEAVPATDEKPGWYGWRADRLTVKDGKIAASDLGPGIPNAEGQFRIETSPREPGGDPFYRVRVDNISFDNPLFPAVRLRTGGVMDLDLHPIRLWTDEQIDEVRVNGHRVELNDAFMKLFEAGPAAPSKEDTPPPAEAPPPASDASPPKPGTAASRPWKIRRLLIDDSEVGIDDVGAGKRLAIPIQDLVLENVPLSTAGLQDVDAANRVHKVEVPSVFLYEPITGGQTVVELPVNFIHFSFAGLLSRRLERVELVAPKIKAGRPLFNFIDFAKERFAAAAAVPPVWPQLVDAGPAGAALAEALAPQAEVPGKQKKEVWDIPFFTESGIVITAPLGREWKQIPRLPFRNARVREGPNKGQPIPFKLHGEEVHGELAIVPGWYDFPDYKLRVRMSDEGRVVFNFPLKDKDNNLVEVFQNNTILYRGLQIDRVWLSVTYDMEGIYIGFGGETCGGYITGKFNLYLDQVYSWDASASFTGINMKPLTSKLSKDYVLIDGIVDALNVNAYGDMQGLYQTSADLTMSRRGRLRVKSLDDLRERFVIRRENWKDDAGRVLLDMLRDVEFTSAAGTARLFGQEGKVSLKLQGRDGVRDITVNLHDYRNRPEKAVIRF